MYFKARTSKWDTLHITADMIRLPEETHCIDIDVLSSVSSVSPVLDQRTLIRLLRNSSKVKEVNLVNIGDELSPETVELLEVILALAESIDFCPFQSDLAYSCLTSCLSQPDGLKELSIRGDRDLTQISIDQAQLLFEGVASSSCLKVLLMREAIFEPDYDNEENYEYFCTAFLDALQRNRSLKILDFDLKPFANGWGFFQRIFKAAVLDTKIETLYLSSHHLGHLNIPSNLLDEALCNDECKLKELTLSDCAIVQSSNDDQSPNNPCNKSLEKLGFVDEENLDLPMMVEVARRFCSLVSLEIQGRVTHLSLLDPLLIGDEQRLSLQRLQLDGSEINEHHAIEFFRKLPQMTCIREVRLPCNPFVSSEAWVPVLVDGIQRNKSVEYLDVECRYVPMPKKELVKACSKIDDALRRNQERRLTEEFLIPVRSEVLPEKLWPLVLERAQKPIPLNLRKTYTRERVKQPSESVLDKDLVYRLLKEKMLQDHLC